MSEEELDREGIELLNKIRKLRRECKVYFFLSTLFISSLLLIMLLNIIIGRYKEAILNLMTVIVVFFTVFKRSWDIL